MENQETNQEEIFSTLVEVPNYTEPNKNKKECKSCKNKALSSGNLKLVAIGVAILFLGFYGLVQIVKDIASLFTR
jgi:hypothetical protein